MTQSKKLNLVFAAMLIGSTAVALPAIAGQNSIEYTDDGVRLQLPEACGGGDYFLISDQDDFVIGAAQANKNIAAGLSVQNQQAAAVKISASFAKVVTGLENGDDSLLKQMYMAKNVQYDDVASFTTTTDNQTQWGYAVENVGTVSAASDPTMLKQKTMAGKASVVKSAENLLNDYFFKDLLVGKGKAYAMN
jgi:hypothetical protein